METKAFGPAPESRIFGAVIGIVVDNNDPEGLYRVKVKFPWVKESTSKYSDAPDKEDFVSTWARVATFMAGNQRGAFWLPEVDDEVLVVFEHGDVRRPFVIGSLWSPVDKAIHDNKSQGGKNHLRTIMSRSGHVVQFIDEPSKEMLIIQTKVDPNKAMSRDPSRGGHHIILDESDGALKIHISDGKQKNFVTIDSTNNCITVESKEGDIVIKAPNGTVQVRCKTLDIESSQSSKIVAKSSMNIKAQSTMGIESGSGMTIKGATVKIN